MEADFPGFFRDMIDLWNMVGPKTHAAVYLGLALGALGALLELATKQSKG